MNVAIVEDHKILAEALTNSLQGNSLIKDIRLFTNGDSFLEASKKWVPNLIISDLLMGGISGSKLIKAYRSQLGEDIKIIVLSSVTRQADVEEVMLLGANCFLSKEESIETLVKAIHKVIDGETYVSDSILAQFETEAEETGDNIQLSPREKEVLNLICSGRIMKEVAHDLNLSIHTVQTYHKNAMRKFDVRRTSDLIIAAIKQGFYKP